VTVIDVGVPVPGNATELEEMLGDATSAGKILKDTKTLASFMQQYADKTQGDGTDLNRQIAAEVQIGLQAFLKDQAEKDGSKPLRPNLDPQNTIPGTRSAIYNAKAPGAALDGQFSSLGDFAWHAWHANTDAAAQTKMAGIRNAFSSVVPADGGFLVPETLRAQLLQVALETAVVRPRATVVPMEAPRVPFPAIDTTTNAGSVFGGMTAYWGEEGAALTDSSAKFARIILDAKKLTGYSVVPNELLQDSLVSFEALVMQLWPKVLAWFEDIGFISGTGAGEPFGWLGASNPASVAVAAETAQPTATVVYENIAKMYARMLPASLPNAAWFVSPDVIPQLLTMALSVGTGGNSIFVANAAGPAPMTLLGRPVIMTEKCSALGTRGDIVFADLSYYLIGDRMTMSAASSVDYRFGNDQTAFRLIQRVDGRPWIQSPITPQNGSSNTLTPFVELATR
jgi:HK97 family phage major capsid protein